MLEEKGVEFHLNAGVKEIVMEDGKVRDVAMVMGSVILCPR